MIPRALHPLRLRRWFRNREQSEYALTIFYALLIGGGVGVVGALFYKVLQFVQRFFFRASEEQFSSLPWLTLLLVPVLGGMIQAALSSMFPDVASRKGVVEVMKSLKLKQGVITTGTTVFHMLAPVVAMGTGGSVGPEGPACQLGAGIASRIGQFFQVSPGRLKVMVAAGSGAAISAIFNAPLGGVFFALEIILLNDLKDVTFGVLILASVVANVVSHALLGGHSLFVFPALELPAVRYLPVFLLLGVAGGLISVGFMKWSSTLAKLIWGRWRTWPRWVFPPLAGLLLGITAQWFPGVLGVGYHGIQQALGGEFLLWTAAALLLLKVLLTATTIELGGFGGTFAPSLFIGAMLGALTAQLASLLGLPINGPLLVLTGMGTVLAGMNGIPLTAFLLLVELTGNYDMVLPMMIAVSGTTLVIQSIVHERSLYIFKLKKARLYSDTDGTTLLAETPIRELVQRPASRGGRAQPPHGGHAPVRPPGPEGPGGPGSRRPGGGHAGFRQPAAHHGRAGDPEDPAGGGPGGEGARDPRGDIAGGVPARGARLPQRVPARGRPGGAPGGHRVPERGEQPGQHHPAGQAGGAGEEPLGLQVGPAFLPEDTIP
jgi:CIC family chloride channel protein